MRESLGAWSVSAERLGPAGDAGGRLSADRTAQDAPSAEEWRTALIERGWVVVKCARGRRAIWTRVPDLPLLGASALPPVSADYRDARQALPLFDDDDNLSMRMAMRRFTRLTNAFSKKAENHAAAIALYVTYDNFPRVHQSLRVTPAMEAGLSDHVWSIEEIVGLLL
jgi:hypothetical protein